MHGIFVVLGSLSYCYFLVRKIPKGILRLISLLPIFYLFSTVPWYFSSAFARGISSFFVTWITSFKLLLFSFDRGPLISPKNPIDFAMVAVFPFKMKDKRPPPAHDLSKLLLGFAKPFMTVLFLIISFTIYGLPLFSVLLVVLIIIINGETLGRYEVVQLFNKPYLATSLQDFWGRRWNRMSSDILRQTIYDPTRHCLMGTVGVGPAKLVATITTLAVSGIMHEMVFYYITCGMKPTWEVTWLFVLHGLCMVLETGLKRLARVMGWPPVNPAVSTVCTVGFASVTSYWLLVLPVWRSTQKECRSIGTIY